MAECTHDCSSCSENCSERNKESMLLAPNKFSRIKKVVGIVSGKGGVGKSLVTSLLAVTAARKNYCTAILDADVTGPSIPQIFGVHGTAMADESGLYPAETSRGIKIMSVNLLLEQTTDPVVWRGPVIAGAVSQFWTDVVWGDVDIMFVDMPPGTGDVPLTVFQSLPVCGIVVVTSPQELVEMIVGKAIKMAEMLRVPVLGVVENMSYFVCDGCGKRHDIFGKSTVDDFAKRNGIPAVCKLPLDPALARLCDAGEIESFGGDMLDPFFEQILRADNRK